jgi:hypothetical protein
MVAAGVGLNNVVSGDISIDVPGTVVVAYLYWAGVDYKPGGVNQAIFDGIAITADFSYEEDFWYANSEEYYHYVYGKDVSSLINNGLDTYPFSGIDGMLYPYGAGLVVIYEDLELPINRVVLKDGLDTFHFDFAVPNGPNSDITCFDFSSTAHQRETQMVFIVGGTEHDDRPNKIWTQTGKGPKPTDLITTPSSVGGPYPLYGADGRAWDTYTDTIPVNAGDEWLCTQIESIISPGLDFPEFVGRGTSALLIATGFVLPVETPPVEPEGLTPGFWKNHPDLWQSYLPDDKFSDIFGVQITLNAGSPNENTDPTLLEAINADGGVVEKQGIYNALARHAVAALLNAAHPDVSYPMTEQNIINAVKEAIENSDLTDAEPLKDMLDSYNNLGGGIDAHGDPL